MDQTTHRHRLHLTNLLDLMASVSDLEAFEDRLNLCAGEQPLLRGLGTLLLHIGPTKDNFIVLVIFIEQSLLIVDRARGDLHLDCMLLSVLLDLLQMLVIAVLGKPGDNIALRPVDLKGMLVLIVDVILLFRQYDQRQRDTNTYVDGHLINVYTLLDAELRNIDIESSIEDTNDLSLTHNRTIALSQVGNQQAKEQMSGLLLRELSRILLAK